MAKPALIKIITILILFIFTAIPLQAQSNHLGPETSFEAGADGYLFGKINRAVINGGAQNGSKYLDVSGPCAACPSSLSSTETEVNGFGFDVVEPIASGSRYKIQFYFKSAQGGTIKVRIWGVGNGVDEKIDSATITGTSQWKKFEHVGEFTKGGMERIRVRFYLTGTLNGKNYNFDNLLFVNDPWLIAHRYLYHRIPYGVHWVTEPIVVPPRESYEGWEECYVCGGNTWRATGNKSANPKKVIGPEPWRREIGSGDGSTYPYLGIYDDANMEVQKYIAISHKNAGIDGWALAYWSDRLPNSVQDAQSGGSHNWQQTRDVLVPYFSQLGFKFYVIDEMTYDWNETAQRDTQSLQNKATAVLKTLKDKPSYLRIEGKPVYMLGRVHYYERQGKLAQLTTALRAVETSIGEEVYWYAYETDTAKYPNWASTPIRAFIDGYGTSSIIHDNRPDATVTQSVSSNSATLRNIGKGYVLALSPSFDARSFNGHDDLLKPRANGTVFLRNINIFKEIKPRPALAFASVAEWQEGKIIEPAASWGDDTSTDPYRYLKLLGNFTGEAFTPPPLPDPKYVDPLRAGEVYGRDSKIDLTKSTVYKLLPANKSVNFKISLQNSDRATSCPAKCAPWTTQTHTLDQKGVYRLSYKLGSGSTQYVNIPDNKLVEDGQIIDLSIPVSSGTSGSDALTLRMEQSGFTAFGQEVQLIIRVATLSELVTNIAGGNQQYDVNGDAVLNGYDFVSFYSLGN